MLSCRTPWPTPAGARSWRRSSSRARCSGMLWRLDWRLDWRQVTQIGSRRSKRGPSANPEPLLMLDLPVGTAGFEPATP